MSAMPSPDKNEPSTIAGSRFVGGNYTRHKQREFACSAVQFGRQKYGLFWKTRPPVSFVMSTALFPQFLVLLARLLHLLCD